MKFNIVPEQCTFVINKEKRTVVCYMESTRAMFINFIDEHCYVCSTPFSLSFRGGNLNQLFSKLEMPNHFIGVAKCSENDVWDEKIGRTIAFERMKEKILRSFFKRADTFFSMVDGYLDNFFFEINELGAKLEKQQELQQEYIESKVKGATND